MPYMYCGYEGMCGGRLAEELRPVTEQALTLQMVSPLASLFPWPSPTLLLASLIAPSALRMLHQPGVPQLDGPQCLPAHGAACPANTMTLSTQVISKS